MAKTIFRKLFDRITREKEEGLNSNYLDGVRVHGRWCEGNEVFGAGSVTETITFYRPTDSSVEEIEKLLGLNGDGRSTPYSERHAAVTPQTIERTIFFDRLGKVTGKEEKVLHGKER